MEKHLRYDLWALVENQDIKQIGPFPYAVKDDQTGFVYQVRGKYDPQKREDRTLLAEKFNFYPVYSEDQRDDIDPDIINQIEPTDYVDENGNPVRKHNYAFTTNVRHKMIDKVLAKAELYRRSITPTYGGQVEEYKETELEAVEFNKLSETEQDQADEQQWPFLAAGIGTDIVDGQIATSLKEVADLVIATSIDWRDRLSQIRNKRKQAAFNIGQAEDDQQAYEVYKQIFSSFNDRVKGSSQDPSFIQE